MEGGGPQHAPHCRDHLQMEIQGQQQVQTHPILKAGGFSKPSIPGVSVSPVQFCSRAVLGAPVPLLLISDVLEAPVPSLLPSPSVTSVSLPRIYPAELFPGLLLLQEPQWQCQLRALVIKFPLGFWVCSHATPRAWNDLQTFTAPFHCFLPGPSSKLSFPTMDANLLTMLYKLWLLMSNFIISVFSPYLFICCLLVLQGAFFGAKINFLFWVFNFFNLLLTCFYFGFTFLIFLANEKFLGLVLP